MSKNQIFDYKSYFAEIFRPRAEEWELPQDYIVALISHIKGDLDFLEFHRRMWKIFRQGEVKRYDLVAAHPPLYISTWLEGLRQYNERYGIV